MIDFNKNSIFNLKEISVGDVRKEIQAILIDGEEILKAFKTARDQVIFTTDRIISIDIQGITGKKKEFGTLPYKMIQYFTIQTPGFAEIFADSELNLFFSNGISLKYEFKGKVDIYDICKCIGKHVLR